MANMQSITEAPRDRAGDVLLLPAGSRCNRILNPEGHYA